LTAKGIALELLGSFPIVSLLRRCEQLPYGRQLLNGLSPSGKGVYLTFEEAWRAAGRSKYAGHDHPEDIAIHLGFSRGLRASDYAVLYWLAQSRSPHLRLFDFGGSVGNLFYSYSPYLNGLFPTITWTVLDLPVIVEAGRSIAQERGISNLNFTDSIQDSSDHNVLLVSGALHYWEKSINEFIEQFPFRPEHIIVNRTPVHATQSAFITLQSTKSYACPCFVRNADHLITSFAGMGYSLVDRWPALELSLPLPLFPDRTVDHYSGFYFRLATSATK
jgi:putative methyltransferase (TIGR04325 family)